MRGTIIPRFTFYFTLLTFSKYIYAYIVLKKHRKLLVVQKSTLIENFKRKLPGRKDSLEPDKKKPEA